MIVTIIVMPSSARSITSPSISIVSPSHVPRKGVMSPVEVDGITGASVAAGASGSDLTAASSASTSGMSAGSVMQLS